MQVTPSKSKSQIYFVITSSIGKLSFLTIDYHITLTSQYPALNVLSFPNVCELLSDLFLNWSKKDGFYTLFQFQEV